MSNQTWPSLVYAAPASGAALTAAAAASCLPVPLKPVLDANFFKYVGQQIQIKAWGIISNAVTTPGTARFDVRLGGTVVFDSLAIALDTAVHTNAQWELDIMLTCRVIGSAAQVMGQGEWRSENGKGVLATPPQPAVPLRLPWNSAPALGTAFDDTASKAFDLFFTQTVATGSLTLHQCQLLSWN